MKLENKLEVRDTLKVGVLPTALTSNLSVLLENEGLFQKRTLGSIINRNENEYLPSFSSSFPDIFNFNTSTTYNNQQLNVSLKNQVRNTVFAAPTNLNGTPAFRMLEDSDLSQTTVVLGSSLNNYVPYTGATANVNLGTRSITSTGGFIGNATTASTLATARTINGTSFNGSANIVTSYWGTARNITIGNTTKSVNGSGNVAWSLAEIGAASQSSLDNYLPLSGGTLTGELSVTNTLSVWTATQGVNRDAILEFKRGNTSSTGYGATAWADARIIFSNDLTIERKVSGNTNNLLKISSTGLITSTNDGDSSQWKQAYDWGDHALAGYWNIKNPTGYIPGSLLDLDLALNGTRGLTQTNTLNKPSGSGTYSDFVAISQYGNGDQLQLSLPFRGNDYIGFRTKSSTGFSNWRELIHDGNLDSQATTLGFIKSSALSGYVPTSRTLTAGNGLSGGGNLTANRTFTLGTPSSVGLTSTNSVTTSSHTHALDASTITAINNGQTAFGWGNHAGRYLSNTISDLGYTELFSGDLNTLPNGSYIQAIGGSSTNGASGIGIPRSLISFGARNSNDSTLQSDILIGTEGFAVRNRANNIWRTTWHSGNLLQSSIDNWNTAYGWGNFRDFGLGITTTTPATALTSTTIDDPNFPNGLYHVASAQNPYFSSSADVLIMRTGATGYITQKMQLINSGDVIKMYLRHYKPNTSAWTPWREVITDENLDSQATSLGFIKASALPTVNNGQLTLSTGTGLSGSATFTANQSGSSTFSVAVASTHKLPTITEWNALPTSNTITRLRGTASGTFTSGDLTLLSGAGIGVSQSGANFTIINNSPNVQADWNATSGDAQILNKPTSFDSIFAYSTQGGLYTTNWNSFALGDKAISIGFGAVANTTNSIVIGSTSFVGGFGSVNVGYSSAIKGSLSSNLGHYNNSNALMANMLGLGLESSVEGLTIIGRYNKPLPSIDFNTSTPHLQPVFLIGKGRDETERSNAVTVFADGRADYESDYSNTNWKPETLVTKKYVDDSIAGGASGAYKAIVLDTNSTSQNLVPSFANTYNHITCNFFGTANVNIAMSTSGYTTDGLILEIVAPTAQYQASQIRWYTDPTNIIVGLPLTKGYSKFKYSVLRGAWLKVI